jgi:hypothetical protein
MAWRLAGQLIEVCSCNMFCPCWFGVKELMVMDQGWCAGAWVLDVRQGHADGVDLGGTRVVLGVHYPGPTVFDGNGTVRLYIAEGADAAQRRELEAICTGTRGGPMEVVRPLFSTWLPTQVTAIDVQEEGDTVAVTVGAAGQLRSQLLRGPEGQAFTLQGGGFVAGLGLAAAELAPSSSRWADPEMPHQFEAISGARGAFTWSA